MQDATLYKTLCDLADVAHTCITHASHMHHPCITHRTDEADEGKVLVGLNFYGYAYSAKKHAEALLGSDYIALLKKHNPRITYDAEMHEHVFRVHDGEVLVCEWAH